MPEQYPRHPLKALCVCAAGMVRSVTLMFLFKAKYGFDALASGVGGNSPETNRMLYEWADYVFVLDKNLLQFIPEEYQLKTVLFDVGPDIWSQPCHPGLVDTLTRMCEERIKIEV